MVKSWRVCGATVIQVGASVWVSVGWMKVKGTYGILTFFNFIANNINGGVSMILGCTSGRGLPI